MNTDIYYLLVSILNDKLHKFNSFMKLNIDCDISLANNLLQFQLPNSGNSNIVRRNLVTFYVIAFKNYVMNWG